MKTLSHARDYYRLSYTDHEHGPQLIEVDSKDTSLSEALKKIVDAGYYGPVKVHCYWILNDSDGNEYKLESLMAEMTV